MCNQGFRQSGMVRLEPLLYLKENIMHYSILRVPK